MSLDKAALRREVVRLAPWHLDVEITPGISSGLAYQQGEEAPYHYLPLARQQWLSLMLSIYPGGLAGRTLLDCACNCGGYSFWSRELGGGGGLGFDARQQWIDQARFLQSNRVGPSDRIRFEVLDLMSIPAHLEDEYDVTLFKGIFYHLADPIHGLKLAAERTRELLIVNTAARYDLPDGMLVEKHESVDEPMSGIHGLSWHPTGPGVISSILKSLGFVATRTTFWTRSSVEPPSKVGRLEVVAARDESTFYRFDSLPRSAGIPAKRKGLKWARAKT